MSDKWKLPGLCGQPGSYGHGGERGGGRVPSHAGRPPFRLTESLGVTRPIGRRLSGRGGGSGPYFRRGRFCFPPVSTHPRPPAGPTARCVCGSDGGGPRPLGRIKDRCGFLHSPLWTSCSFTAPPPPPTPNPNPPCVPANGTPPFSPRSVQKQTLRSIMATGVHSNRGS